MIIDLKENTEIKEKFLIANMTRGVTNAGLSYLNIVFQDHTGQIEGRKWEIKDNDEEVFQVGNIVEIKAQVIKYRNVLQLKVGQGEIVKPEDIDIADYIASAPVSREVLQRKLFDYVNSIENIEIKKVVESIVTQNILSLVIYPAASRNHHEYASGLIHHTVSMLDDANALAKLYKNLNRSFLYAGIILHDIGKTIELSGPVLPKYTLEGKLIGHISIIQALIKETCDKLEVSDEVATILQHLVLSHHGKKEFGSPVLPQILEAEVIYLIDNLDSRINMIEKMLQSVNEGEFTQRAPFLEDRSFYKPKIK